MRPNALAAVLAGALVTAAAPATALAQVPAAMTRATNLAQVPVAPKPIKSPAAASYWGPATTPAASAKKPSALRRWFGKLGNHDDAEFTPAYRDPATGRSTPGWTKPWVQPIR